MSNINVLAEIRRVLELESRAIAGLQKNLGPDYEEAVRLLFACHGKVVVTGKKQSYGFLIILPLLSSHGLKANWFFLFKRKPIL